MQKLTKEQALIISGYTSVMAVNNMQDLMVEISRRLGREISSDEFLIPEFHAEFKEAFREDFFEISYKNPDYREDLIRNDDVSIG